MMLCVILRESKRTELAHLFLDYLLRPEVAAGIVMKARTACANEDGSRAAAGRHAGESDFLSAGRYHGARRVGTRQPSGDSEAARPPVDGNQVGLESRKIFIAGRSRARRGSPSSMLRTMSSPAN